MHEMDKRIVLESRGKEPSQVVELCLDNARTSGEFEGLTDEFTSLKTLSAINASITTLKGFPKLKSLKKCDLSENRLSGGLQALKGCTSLVHLNITKNKIKSFEAIEPLKSLENLEHLEIHGNDIYTDLTSPDAAEQRQKVFEILPNLKWVDNYDRLGNELDDDDDDDIVPNGVERLSEGEDDEEDEDGDDEDGEEEYSSEEEEDGPGLSALYGDPSIINDDDDGDYDEEEEDEEADLSPEDEENEEEEAEHPVRGKKRKLDDEATT